VVEHFATLISRGDLAPGDRLPTYFELQRQFGLAANTISRAMIELEQQGLIERRRRSGVYVAERVTTPPAMRRHHGIIGLCGSGFHDSASSFYWAHLSEGVRAQAQGLGSQILLLPYGVLDGWEKVDGVLTVGILSDSHHDAIPPQLPIVSLFESRPDWASVEADEYAGLKQAIAHLLALGHQRIAYLYSLDASIVPYRLKGYEDSLRGAGIAPRKNWMRLLSGVNHCGPDFATAARRDTAAWLSDKGPNGWEGIGCTALLCHNDDTALGAIQALNQAGLKVPDDVSVVGFDGTEISAYSPPQLTTVEVPLRRMGEIAIELLQKQIAADEVIVEHRTLPTQLRVRQSTAAPPHH